MKKIVSGLLILMVFAVLDAQQNQIRLIIRADDMGSSHSADQAIIKSCKEGIATTVEIMAPAPWFPEAVKLLQQYPDADAGIHLTLTSEWENVKWRPLTHGPSLVNREGYFYAMIYPNPNYPSQSVRENNLKLEEIEKEFRAQIELVMKEIPWTSHISSHMGCSEFSPEVKKMVIKLAQEYKLLYETASFQVKPVGYDGPQVTSSEKVQSFINMLNKLEPGNTYLFIDHPGINDPELQAVYHIGYEQVALDRQGVTDVFTDEKVKALIHQKGIHLIGYKNLAPR